MTKTEGFTLSVFFCASHKRPSPTHSWVSKTIPKGYGVHSKNMGKYGDTPLSKQPRVSKTIPIYSEELQSPRNLISRQKSWGRRLHLNRILILSRWEQGKQSPNQFLVRSREEEVCTSKEKAALNEGILCQTRKRVRNNLKIAND